MSEVTPLDRLQPYLLDRLTAPLSRDESETWSVERLQESVVRDLLWLFNTKAYPPGHPIFANRDLAASVLNYGMPDLTGVLKSSLPAAALEDLVRTAIQRFEPRIDPKKLTVRAAATEAGTMQLSLEIEAEVWALPEPAWIRMRAAVDVQTGDCTRLDTLSTQSGEASLE